MTGGCPHPDQWDDPTVCPAPCGLLHTRCGVCHAALQPCPWETKVRILGIDPSLTSTGIAVITDSRPVTAGGLELAFATTEVFKTAGKRADPVPAIDARITRIADFVLDHARSADIAIIEGASSGSAGASASPWDRAGLWWRIVHRLLAADIPVAVCPPTVRAKWATGVGGGPKASKPMVAVAVARLWPSVDAESDDEWDALGMATIAAQWMGLEVPTRAHHAATHASVAWPDIPAGIEEAAS